MVKNKQMELRKKHPQPQPEQVSDSAFERRMISEPVQYRAGEGDGMGEVFGYALKWDVEYDMNGFTEKIARGALDKSDMSDVRILQDHVSHLILGRTKAGTATVGTDEIGMWYRCTLPNSPNGQNMREALIRGDVDQSSWGFQIRRDQTGRRTGDKWELRDGREYRTIFDISIVFDASPVTFPANPDTSAAKRSRDEYFAAHAEKRDDGEMEGEDMPEVTQVIPDSWEIAWMVDTLAWATSNGNSMISSLNYYGRCYDEWAQEGSPEYQAFIGLSEQCKAAKSAIVTLIDAHIDALKILNASENRSEESNTQTHNSLNPLLLQRELQLKEAEIRVNNLRHEICN